MLRPAARWISATAALLVLAACAGHETGNGLSRLDTITEEDKAKDEWFKSFYGSEHCTWGSGCKSDSGW